MEPGTPRYQLDAASLVRFGNLRDEAVRHAFTACEVANPDLHLRFGEKGRAACAEDMGFHLDFLRPVLETNDIAPYVAYLGWLAQVLGSRGVPLGSVHHALDSMAAFFQARMGSEGASIAAALTDGNAALACGIAASAFDDQCPSRWEEAEPDTNAAVLGQRDEAISLLDHAFTRVELLPSVAIHVIQPAMYEVGRHWQHNTVSVAREHFATALSQSWMARQMAQSKALRGNGLRALFACLAGNHHVMGPRMVADAFELDGWAAEMIGPNARTDAVIQRVREYRPDLVGFSASLPRQLPAVRQAVGELHALFGDGCPKIVVGGLAFNHFPNLANWVGAKILAPDAVGAVEAAATMFSIR